MLAIVSKLCSPFVIHYVILFTIVLNVTILHAIKSSSSTHKCKTGSKTPSKLLVLLLDGFRWDYYDTYKDKLPGFQKFLRDGVQVEYVEPVFPSLSLPSWATISTGQYPAYHNVLGNQMLRRGDAKNPEMIFDYLDDSSMDEIWWESAEPIWTTATKKDFKVYMANFARCDVPFKGILPTECTGFDGVTVFNYTLYEHLNEAIDRFRVGYELAMLYDGRVDIAGHKFGPNDENLLWALQDVDSMLLKFLQNLESYKLQKEVNIVITSDHGITSMENAIAVRILDYIDNPNEIYKVIGCDTIALIATEKGKSNSVYNQLSKMPGVDTYKLKDIPDMFHIKESRYMHDIMLVAKPNYYIVGIRGKKQLPRSCQDGRENSEPAGNHGYFNLSDMRSIFFARGPAFRNGIVHPPIGLVDQYQVFTYVLGLQSCRDNGSWSKVADMLA